MVHRCVSHSTIRIGPLCWRSRQLYTQVYPYVFCSLLMAMAFVIPKILWACISVVVISFSPKLELVVLWRTSLLPIAQGRHGDGEVVFIHAGAVRLKMSRVHSPVTVCKFCGGKHANIHYCEDSF